MNTTDHAKKHEQRMHKVKQQMDRKIAQANQERGIILLLTGNGKGKSSSAFGILSRSLGHQQQCGVVQFIKGAWECGEQLFFTDLPGVDYYALGGGFTWETQNMEQDRKAAQAAWQQSHKMLTDSRYNLVILDEMTYMFRQNLLDINEVVATLRVRPQHMNVVITGRSAVEELVAIADTVSEVKDIKHAFRSGIKAQKGIEF
jgi:cob(I)alamin adenosyltransferase